jgi:hypothetical protein
MPDVKKNANQQAKKPFDFGIGNGQKMNDTSKTSKKASASKTRQGSQCRKWQQTMPAIKHNENLAKGKCNTFMNIKVRHLRIDLL